MGCLGRDFRVVLILVVVGCLGLSMEEACIKPSPVHVKKDWFMDHLGSWWYVPMSSVMDTDRAMSIFAGTADGTENDSVERKQICLDSEMTGASFSSVNSYCQYNYNEHIESQTCVSSKGVLSIVGPQVASRYTFVKTDNSTYVLVTMCTSNVENSWLVLGKKDKALPAPIKNKILAKLKALGFKKGNGGDGIKPTKVKFRKCTGDD